jgi:hypothetical protein
MLPVSQLINYKVTDVEEKKIGFVPGKVLALRRNSNKKRSGGQMSEETCKLGQSNTRTVRS